MVPAFHMVLRPKTRGSQKSWFVESSCSEGHESKEMFMGDRLYLLENLLPFGQMKERWQVASVFRRSLAKLKGWLKTGAERRTLW